VAIIPPEAVADLDRVRLHRDLELFLQAVDEAVAEGSGLP
jgi:hypothetical protein